MGSDARDPQHHPQPSRPASGPDIEAFLLAEFAQQHENIRQIEGMTFQRVQFFFTIESLLIGGLVTVATASGTGARLLDVAFLAFWLLAAVGHLTYQTAIQSMINMIKLDFANLISRLFFAAREDARSYLVLAPDAARLLERKPGEWETHRDNSVLVAKLVGAVNSANLVAAAALTLYSVARLLAPHVTARGAADPAWVLSFGLSALVVTALTHSLYQRLFFLRVVRREEKATLARQARQLSEIPGLLSGAEKSS